MKHKITGIGAALENATKKQRLNVPYRPYQLESTFKKLIESISALDYHHERYISADDLNEFMMNSRIYLGSNFLHEVRNALFPLYVELAKEYAEYLGIDISDVDFSDFEGLDNE